MTEMSHLSDQNISAKNQVRRHWLNERERPQNEKKSTAIYEIKPKQKTNKHIRQSKKMTKTSWQKKPGCT